MPETTPVPPLPGSAGAAVPRVLVYTEDADEGARIRDACEQLDCRVQVAATPQDAVTAVRSDPRDVVFVDATAGERRLGDIITAAKQASPHVAVILLGSTEQVETDPALLMMVGYEFLTRPIHADAVSAEVRLRLNQQRVRRVSAALSSTLEYDGILAVLLELATHEVSADASLVLMPREGYEGLRLERAHGLLPNLISEASVAREISMAEWVYESGEPIITQGGFADVALATPEGARRIATAMFLPLILGERTLGVLATARLGEDREPFALRELWAMEVVASQAAVAIHNARSHAALLEQEKWRHELEVARAVQQHLLPQQFPTFPNVQVHAINLPAKQIGGDFYNVFRLGPTRFGVVVGDVSGKGIPGALLMTQCMNDMRRAVEDETEPDAVVAMVNNTVAEHSTRGMFVTLWYAVLDLEAQQMDFANAGHLPMLVRPGDTGVCKYVGHAEDPPLGIIPGNAFTRGSHPIRPGDSLLLYTDGVIEAKNAAGEEYGFDRLKRLFENGACAAPSPVEAVTASVEAFAGGQPQHDDLTLLAIQLGA